MTADNSIIFSNFAAHWAHQAHSSYITHFIMEEKKNKEKEKERVEERWLEITEELENGQDN